MTVDWHQRFTQQAAWTRDLRAYLLEKAGIRSARRVLEAGCGTGAILTELPGGPAVHGLDLDRARLVRARTQVPGALLARGDARDLPYPDFAFDITFCHYLLLWVPRPERAVAEMARVTRPGGAVLAMAEPDYSQRIDEPAALKPLGGWQREALIRQGADPDLGRRLADLFRKAGIEVIETGTLQARSGRPSASERDLEWAVLQADLGDSVPERELLELKALDAQAWERGQRVQHVPTYYVLGRV